MSLSSFALVRTASAAYWIGAMRALIESSFGRPFLSALIVISAFDLSRTSLASASILSSGSVHSMLACALTDALALHCAEALTSAWPSHEPLQVPLHSPLHSPPLPPVPALPLHPPSHLPWTRRCTSRRRRPTPCPRTRPPPSRTPRR